MIALQKANIYEEVQVRWIKKHMTMTKMKMMKPVHQEEAVKLKLGNETKKVSSNKVM